MKAHLIFNLPEDRSEFEDASRAGEIRGVIYDLDEWLRSQIKYSSHDWSPVAVETLQVVRDKLYELAGERNVVIWE
jgi:hypothetical protein